MQRRPAFLKPRVWALSLTAWVVLGTLNAASEVIDVITGDASYPYWEPVTWEYSSILMFALMGPFLIEFALRVRIATTGPLLAIPAHLVGAVVFSTLHVAGMVGIRKAVYRLAGLRYDFGHLGWELLYEGFKDIVTYATIIGLTYGVDYYQRYRERELQASNLQTSLARARLQNLEHRIQPHFLFNTLNMISATMHEDVDQADRMITRLSDLLRMSVQRSGRQEVALSEELELLDAYLDIMRARFERRLDVAVQVEEGIESALVPPLLLQPLVENAIKHGIAGRDEGGRIEIRITRDGSRLSLEVEDDGPGPGASREVLLSKGVGLSTTAERLEQLYGSEAQLSIGNGEPAGFSLHISIPYRTGANRPATGTSP